MSFISLSSTDGIHLLAHSGDSSELEANARRISGVRRSCAIAPIMLRPFLQQPGDPPLQSHELNRSRPALSLRSGALERWRVRIGAEPAFAACEKRWIGAAQRPARTATTAGSNTSRLIANSIIACR